MNDRVRGGGGKGGYTPYPPPSSILDSLSSLNLLSQTLISSFYGLGLDTRFAGAKKSKNLTSPLGKILRTRLEMKSIHNNNVFDDKLTNNTDKLSPLDK